MLGRRPAPPPAQPVEKVRQATKTNPLRKVKTLPPPEERFSSAPVYESVYTPDDYGADGKLKRIKDVPLGAYPIGVAAQLEAYSHSDFAPPPTPIAPPRAVPLPAAPKTKKAASTGVSKKVPPPPPPAMQAAPEVKEMTSENAPLAERVLVEEGPPKQRVFMPPLPPPPRTADGKYDGSDPPEFRDPAHHYIAVVSWITTRHPREDAILEHRYQQDVARKEGRYNPHEDPPVDLRQITPLVTMRVTKTFSKQECDYKDGEVVAAYAEKLRDVTGWNVLTLLCGEPQPLPVADSVRGHYKEPALQQQMGAFYDNQEASKTDIMERIKRDQAEGERTHAASKQASANERAAAAAAPAPAPAEPETETETSVFAAVNEQQRKMREAAGVAVQTDVSWADQTEQEEIIAAAAKPTTWAGVAAAAASLPAPVIPADVDMTTPAQSPFPANNIISVQRPPVGKRAGVRRAAPKKAQ